MDTLIHADIFFLVTTVTIICVGLLALVALYYAIRILHDIDAVSRKARTEAEAVIVDIGEVRQKVKEQGIKVAGMLAFISRFIKKKPFRSRNTSKE